MIPYDRNIPLIVVIMFRDHALGRVGSAGTRGKTMLSIMGTPPCMMWLHSSFWVLLVNEVG